MSKQFPKTTTCNLCAKNWALVMMLKALPLAHLKQQMIISVKHIRHARVISAKLIDF